MSPIILSCASFRIMIAIGNEINGGVGTNTSVGVGLPDPLKA
jgi:hypothetical protein